ncbi:AGAP005073-PA [Anopheles gambiae str. PEST]|uniref:AGAP005073-PA n=1 Tax=Anopheles gambiae TaxID=7165 RepID=A7UT66_ANOGA|nr:AGAP005073-PA [Anopheles gambiae str. PEST]
MKVDKGVCTNGTLEDLNRAIQFEAVFSTLVENKILAIKRECELKKRHKKSRLLRRILFGRKISTGGAGGSGCCHREVSASNSNSSDGANAAIEPLCPGHNGTAGSVDRQQREGLDAGCYTYGSAVPEASLGVENSTISDGVDEVIVEIGDLSSLVDADGNVVVATTSVEPAVLVEEGSSPQVSAPNRASGASRISAAESSSTKSPESLENRKGSGRTLANAPRKSSLLEPVSIEIEPESDLLSAHYDLEDSATNVSIELDGVSDVSDMRRSIASEPISIIKNSTRSRYGLGSYLSAGNAVANRLRVLEAKSISAQNSPILPRQKPAAEGRHLTFSTATYQQPKSSTKASAIDCDTSFVVDLSQSDRDQEQQQQQQQQQHQHNNSTVIGKDKPTSQVASGGKNSALFLGDNSSSSSASKRNKLTQPHNSNHSAGAVSIGRAAHSAQQQQQQPQQQEAPSSPPLGLIESFNQLTASNLPVIASTARHSPPVNGASKGSAVAPIAGEGVSDAVSGTSAGAMQPLTASLAQPNQQQTQRKQRSFLKQSSCDVELHYRPNVTGTRRSSAKEHHSHRKSSAYGHGDDYSSYIMGYDINESDEEKLNKRKYKYLKRCSDPVIVFPSTSSGAGAVGSGAIGGSGLQHCILSRPPNQPL